MSQLATNALGFFLMSVYPGLVDWRRESIVG